MKAMEKAMETLKELNLYPSKGHFIVLRAYFEHRSATSTSGSKLTCFSFFFHCISAGLWPGGQTRSALRFGAHPRVEVFRRGPGLASALPLRR